MKGERLEGWKIKWSICQRLTGITNIFTNLQVSWERACMLLRRMCHSWTHYCPSTLKTFGKMENPNPMPTTPLPACNSFIPESKRQLVKFWRLVGTWNKIEVPMRATPIGPEILLGFAGLFYKWQWERAGHMLVVAYSAYLRTGEMFRIRREHVVLPTHRNDAAVIFLQDTKTSQRKQMSWEKVLIREDQALACLERL